MSSEGRLALVRHADALARARWAAPDETRPLTAKGERQAEALVAPLRAFAPLRALTSPARRCTATLAPFARAAGIVLEDEPLLAEGTAPGAALAGLLHALGALAPRPDAGASALVACTHGDVVDGIVTLLARQEIPFDVDGRPTGGVVLATPKGARWELVVDEGVVASARLVGPPEPAR